MTKLKLTAKKLTLALTLVALLSSPFGVLAQSTTSETDETTRRKEAAAILKAEADARKAAADAALVEAQIAEKNVTTRRTQLESLKSNSEVSGSLVENGIAASKAIGCAAVDISNEVRRIQASDSTIKSLILFSPTAADSLTLYGALIGEVTRLNSKYSPAVKDLNSKLDILQKAQDDANQARLLELQKELQLLAIQEKITIKNGKPGSKVKINTVWNTKQQNLLMSEMEVLNLNGAKSGTNKAIPTAAVSAILSTALDMFALFKTDVSITGTNAKPGSMDMTGYLFRLLTLRPGLNGTIISRSEPMAIISPDHVVVTNADYDSSELINSLDEVSKNYQAGKGATDRATAIKKATVDAIKTRLNTAGLEEELRLATESSNIAFTALAADPNNIVLRGNYERSLNTKRVAKELLDSTLKKVEQEVASSFDAKIMKELKTVERLNDYAKKMSDRFSDTSETPTAPKKLIGDYLKGEILSKKISGSNAVWLETNITSNGANQRKRSSPIVDVFRQGPELTYSGGAVVSYQLRKLDSSILTAGTVWAYSPYTKSKNITKFLCQGISNDERPVRSFDLKW